MHIIGHRGARGEAPENTLGGFQYIHDLGIRAVEFDVRQLHDRTLVIMHDDNFIRTTAQDRNLYTCSAPDLNQYDQSEIWMDWKNFEVTPQLKNALNILQDFEHLEVEIKAVESYKDAENLLIELERQLQGFEQTAVITSFDRKIHEVLQQSGSTFRRGLLIEDNIQHQAITDALKLDCVQIGWMNTLASDEMIQATQQAGLNISVWTVNDLERAKQLRDSGVQGLITDFPKLMLSALS